MSLNSRQQEAVVYEEGPLLVLAGAGSGKTRVLTQRIIHFIKNRQVSPWNIFAVTFTNKAAKEMKHRVVMELGPSAHDLWISTFHSSCLRILRRHAEALGYTKNFAIYDTSDQLTLIKNILSEKNLSDKLYPPKMILGHIDRAKNAGITPDQFAVEGNYFLAQVRELYVAQQKELLRNQAMDFGDLILNVILLFQKRPDILAEYQNQFRCILIDEYQDTNPVQYQLIRMLSGVRQNIFVVGDDDQSIYKFRGAEIQNILNFQKDYPNAKVIRLEQNYRSTKNILAAANAVIRKNSMRMGKELWTENQSGELITVFQGLTEKDEANFVASKIAEMRDEFSLSDIAIFYRTNSQSRSIEDELSRHHIPYKIFGGMKFYERAEIKDCVAYLRLLVNRADSAALKRILNVPARGLGKTTVDKIEEAAMARGVSFWEILSTPSPGLRPPSPMGRGEGEGALNISPATVLKLKNFVELINTMDSARQDMSLNEFLPYLYEQTGYWQKLIEEKTIEAEGRKENLTEFVNVVAEFMETRPDLKIEDFLDTIALASDADKMKEDDPFVTLMTVHLSKGLEYPVVFLVGMEEGLFPHARSLDKEDDLEEERRICYVGMTRAMKCLFLCHARERKIFGASQYHFPSRFLEDLPSNVVNGVSSSRFVPPSSTKKTGAPERNSTSIYVDRDYSQDETVIQSGALVRHTVFGDGTVKAFEGSGDQLKITVKFRNGLEKKLLFKHAHLQVL